MEDLAMVVRRGPGLVGTMARTAVIAGTASATMGAVSHRQQQKYQKQAAAQQQAAAAQAQPSQQAAGISDNDMAELQKLAELQKQGIITQEEFDAKKKEILGL
jgi:hypothetical protein